MIISYYILALLFLSGIMCFLLVYYVKKIKGLLAGFLLLMSLFFIISVFIFDEVIVINDETDFARHKFFSKMGNFNFTFKNGELLSTPVENNLIVNNTPDQLVVEQVEYGNIGNSSSYKIKIPPFSSLNLEKSINFLFEEPPQTISVRSSESKVRYWLHKDTTP